MRARGAPRAFVVDTCIARSCASRASTAAHATACSSALETIHADGHKAVLYPTLEAEYLRQENMSRFFRRWLGAMRRKDQIEQLSADPSLYGDVRHAMKRLIPAEAHHVVKKDLHLIGAAMATDHRVLSDDDKVRAHLATMATEVAPLGRVHWANPSGPGCLGWLSRGAPDDPTLQLRSR